MSQVPAGYIRLEKSERHAVPNAKLIGPANADEVMTVSVRVRRRAGAPALPDMDHWMSAPAGKRQYLSREELANQFGADPADLKKIEDFAKTTGLKVVESSPARRTVVLSGTVAQMSAAFGVSLGRYKSVDEEYRGREGFISVPASLKDIVEGVFGLDNRRMARRASNGGTVTPQNPVQVAQLYNFPTSANGSGQTIGLIEFGGGYYESDLSAYFTTNEGIGPGFTPPLVTAIGVDGVMNSPGTDGRSGRGHARYLSRWRGCAGSEDCGLLCAVHRTGLGRYCDDSCPRGRKDAGRLVHALGH